VTYKIASV